jgi:hypothetical protein
MTQPVCRIMGLGAMALDALSTLCALQTKSFATLHWALGGTHAQRASRLAAGDRGHSRSISL